MKVVRTREMEWQNGWDVISMMPDNYKENLGPAEQLEEAYSKYLQKNLSIDLETTFRGDLIDLQPGFADLTDAYHDSVEECFFISGDCTLSGEQTFYGYHYFWRPPGFIHAATSVTGFKALLFLHGEDPSEGSGRASRVIQPTELAGTNALTPDPAAALGPRGWVKIDTETLPWLSEEQFKGMYPELNAFGLNGIEIKILSINPETLAMSALIKFPENFQIPKDSWTRGFRAFVLEGSLKISEQDLDAESWFETSSGEEHQGLSSKTGSLIFAKISAKN